MHRKAKRCLSVLLAAALLLSAVSVNTILVSSAESNNEYLSDYDKYVNSCGVDILASSDIQVPLGSLSTTNANAEYKNAAVVWQGDGLISFTLNVEESALYNLKLLWRPLETGVNINLDIQLDGEHPFEDCNEVTVCRMWRNATEPRTDAQGNEYAPEQIETDGFTESAMRDITGAEVDPYLFALSAGTHTLTFSDVEQRIEISQIVFCAPEQPLSYSQISSEYKVEALDADIIALQGEAADVKSSSSIIPKSNNSDAGMTPADPYLTKINYIGGTSWQSPTDKIVWNFNVEKAGYYYLNMRYKQSDLVNGDSVRWLKIDGATPFQEAKSLKFPYGSGWSHYIFGSDEQNPYYIWLDRGSHTISLEVTSDEQSEFFSRISTITRKLGDEYIKIVMITGDAPDVNRDYELFNQIPGFNDTLRECSDSLISLATEMKALSGKRSTQTIASMENMARVLNMMIKNQYIAQQYVSDYYSCYTSLSSWLYDMTDMPLALDEIQFVPAGSKFENKNAHFFDSLSFSFSALLASFTRDYSLTAGQTDTNGKTIRLWVNWGQDQAAALNSLIEDSFTPQTGIRVCLEIVNASLINGILSGNYPDVSLQMARIEPVNLGMRNALYDLTQFDDCEEILARFQQGAEIPYRYNNGLYALPDTQNFFLMFYRTDILESLGLKIPKTWDEFLYASTIIQRNNMSVFMPYTRITTSTTVNTGIGSLNLFPTFMFQNGLSIYNEEHNATQLTTKSAVDVFKKWTDFYNKYDFIKEADFYNRIRGGIMPLGIASYTTYFSLYSAAPEIQGRWAVSTVPATGENGIVAGGGTGCAIINKSDKKAEAWEFLKWWTSATTQARYNNNVESLIGMLGRVATSNIEALSSFAWKSSDLEVILEQWSRVNEVPEVPGSYYMTRAIDQAYWAVINGDSSAKDALSKWSKVADEEITRKIKEYS